MNSAYEVKFEFRALGWTEDMSINGHIEDGLVTVSLLDCSRISGKFSDIYDQVREYAASKTVGSQNLLFFAFIGDIEVDSKGCKL